MKNTYATTPNSGKPSLVFFGSGPVAAESLKLLNQDFAIEAVVTKPSTVKEMCSVALNTCVHSVNNKKELDDLISTQPFESKIAVLIDFGIIVSRKAINYFPLGIINSHFSLLPDLRGADPISFAILSGQKETGVSLMQLVEAMDEGPILAFGIEQLTGTETTPELTQSLIKLSDALLKEILPAYMDDSILEKTLSKVIPRSQEVICKMLGKPFEPTYSRKLTKQDGILDFSKPAVQLEREIRAYFDWPKSRTQIAGKDVVITQAYAVPSTSSDEEPGDIVVVKESKLIYIATASGSLWIEKLKPAGKKEMATEAFLAGHKINSN